MTGDSDAFLQAVLPAARTSRDFLDGMEEIAERLAPERSAELARALRARFGDRLAESRAALDAATVPADLAPFGERFLEGVGHVERCFDLFTTFGDAPFPERIPRILGALHELARAQEAFYALRLALPPFHDCWPPPDGVDERAARRAPDERAPTGLVHVSRGGHHGGFALYVPEHYEPSRAWPLLVALHGGSGNGPDFLWTWLRDAKRRGYVLLAPSAAGATWSDVDDQGLLEILGWLGARYRIDRDRILLTGLSDGGTFTVLYGLLHPGVYRALAPLCGVLHPANEALGNFGRARGVPIYLVHGALDFLFPVHTARFAADTLGRAGADLVYREIAELSHTYPRSENPRILDWFEALPPRR